MYNSNSDYYADLAIMRSEASVISAGGVRKTVNNIAHYRYTVQRFNNDYGLISLYFSMPNLYLQGVHVASSNVFYKFRGSAAQPNNLNIINCTTEEQSFTEDYKAMGWNKSIEGITVTLNDINDAFFAFFSGNVSKAAFRTVVIAFAEGFRFDKVAQKICRGEMIGGKELDWSAPGATVVQG